MPAKSKSQKTIAGVRRDAELEMVPVEVLEAREHVTAASLLLKPLGGEYERISWMLEDSLVYIDQARQKETTENWRKGTLDVVEKLNEKLMSEKLS